MGALQMSKLQKGTQARLFAMMGLELAIWGAWAPKLFPHMASLGFSGWQQSMVGSCWGVAAVAGIFFSNQFADRTFAAERFMSASHLIGGLALTGAAFSTEFWSFLGCFLVFSLVYVPTLSVANSIAFAHLPDAARSFGPVRMGGTVGWVLVSWPFVFLLGPHADIVQTRWIFIVAALVSFVLAGYSLTLPHTPANRDAARQDPLAWREALSLLDRPFVAILFAVTFIDAVIHNGYFVMADAFLTSRAGIAGNLSMVVLSIGQITEIATMFVLGNVLFKLGWKATMIVGVLGHALRFLVFAGFPQSVPLIVAAQLLHGVCYAFFFATLYIFVDSVFPKDVRASAQGLFNLLILGVGNIGASLLFPALMGRLRDVDGMVDYRTLFLVPAGMAVCAALALALFFSPPHARPQVGRGLPA